MGIKFFVFELRKDFYWWVYNFVIFFLTSITTPLLLCSQWSCCHSSLFAVLHYAQIVVGGGDQSCTSNWKTIQLFLLASSASVGRTQGIEGILWSWHGRADEVDKVSTELFVVPAHRKRSTPQLTRLTPSFVLRKQKWPLWKWIWYSQLNEQPKRLFI